MMIDKKIENIVQEIFQQNAYVSFLGMLLESFLPGEAVIKIKIDRGKHTNLYDTAHGGLLASLADVAMSIACLSLQKKVMTMDMHITWLKAAEAEKVIYAYARVLLDGNKNMAAEVDILDENKEVLAKAQATFIVIRKMKFE